MKTKSFLRDTLLATSMIACLNVASHAQNIYARLDGVVTDSQGAAISAAKVTLVNKETSQTRTLTTDDHGNYTFDLLPVGTYSVTIVAQGFKKADIPTVTLDVDQKSREDVRLEIGTIDQQVEVTNATPLVETETSSVGEVIDNKEVIDLPLNGRDFNQLALLVPGVTAGIPGNFLGSGLSVAGGRDSTNNYVIDGIDDNEIGETRVSLAPSVEMIDEFKIQENAYSADSGRYAGGQINITTKSGGNKFHGSAFLFVRNDIFDAENYFDTPANPKPPYKRYQYGGSAGGPIIKDKTFFFAVYEGYRINQGLTALTNVPTALEKTGDFSDSTQQLFFPFSKTPIPGNKITNPDPIALAIAKLYPDPTPNLNRAGFNYENNSEGIKTNSDQYSVRIDHKINEKNSIFARYIYNPQYQFDPFQTAVPGNWVDFPGYGQISNSKYDNAELSYTRIITSNLLNDLRFGYSRYYYKDTIQQANPDAQALGITGLDPIAYTPYWHGTPTIAIIPYGNLGTFFVLPQDRTNNTFQLTENLQWSRGAHTLKFGADLVQFQLYQNNQSYTRGFFIFAGDATGNGLADAFFDIPTITEKTAFSTPQTRNYQYHNTGGFYAQDEWKASRLLTVNYGIRYEADLPIVWKGGEAAAFNPVTGTIQVPSDVKGYLDPTKIALPVAIPVPIEKVARTSLCDYPSKNFAPRVGVADRTADNRTVIRAGYGVFYNIAPINSSCGSGDTLWSFPQTFQPNVQKTLENPFPTSAQVFAPVVNIPSANRNAYIQQYNLGIERQLTSTLVLEVGYLGSKGTHLSVPININQGNMSVPNPAGGYVQPYSALFGTAPLTETAFAGSSNYNGLLVRVEKRAAKGLSFLGSYTYAKSLDNNSGGTTAAPQNSYDLGADYGRSGFDETQRGVFSFVYELPFGRGRMFGSGWNTLENGVLGGWVTTGIFTTQTGFPISPELSTSDDNSETGQFSDRPDQIGNPKAKPCIPGTFFNTCAYALPAAGQFGDASRNSIIGPSYTNLDFGLRKEFGLSESYKFDFRAEVFNILNHPTFQRPDTTFQDSTFGFVSAANASREVQLALRFSF